MSRRTIKDRIRWGAGKLNKAEVFLGHGSDDVFTEARWLILYALNLPINTDDFYLETALSNKEQKKVKKIIKKRIKSRKPAAYITNQSWFCGLEFYVDDRVLVPRSPIAELIENKFEPWFEYGATSNILDLCTGSGCIAVALSYAFPAAKISAADISAAALAVARINLEKHGLSEKIKLYQSDLFSALPAQKYDLIVSNPPYVDVKDMSVLANEYKHEPELGLTAGEDGLEIADKILTKASDYLNPGGLLVVEVGNSKDALLVKYPDIKFIWPDFNYGGDGVFLLQYD